MLTSGWLCDIMDTENRRGVMNTRQQHIIALLEKEGEVTIKELALRLQVSEMTIHRDLDYLEENGILYKKRGAAVFVETSDRADNDFYAEEKKEIGRLAASLIKPGQSILFDNSTTAMECARFLNPNAKYTFYTTNNETTQILLKYQNSVVFCSGGYYFPDSRGYVGRHAEDFVSSVKADVCLIGASGISSEFGLTTPYPMHTALQKKIIASSKTRILCADHSKFGKAAMERFGDMSEMDVIVTDSGVSESVLAEYRRYVNIIIPERKKHEGND